MLDVISESVTLSANQDWIVSLIRDTLHGKREGNEVQVKCVDRCYEVYC